MPINIELKARTRDLGKLLKFLHEKLNLHEVTLQQTDVFFRVPRGRLKMRCEEDGQCEVVYYDRSDRPGPNVSHYFRKKAENPEQKRQELESLYGIKNTVKKERKLFLFENSRIHIDDVQGLGQFVEIEVVLKKRNEQTKGKFTARKLMRMLGIDPADVVSRSYDELLDEKENKFTASSGEWVI